MPQTLQNILRWLPHGPVDAFRQVLLFYLAYYAYSVVRGIADDPTAASAAFDNARGIISLEQTLGFFVEPSIQAWVSGSSFFVDGASWLYLNAQTSITLGALFFIYMWRNPSFYFVRNMM